MESTNRYKVSDNGMEYRHYSKLRQSQRCKHLILTILKATLLIGLCYLGLNYAKTGYNVESLTLLRDLSIFYFGIQILKNDVGMRFKMFTCLFLVLRIVFVLLIVIKFWKLTILNYGAILKLQPEKRESENENEENSQIIVE